jgi:hypothetical protein
MTPVRTAVANPRGPRPPSAVRVGFPRLAAPRRSPEAVGSRRRVVPNRVACVLFMACCLRPGLARGDEASKAFDSLQGVWAG